MKILHVLCISSSPTRGLQARPAIAVMSPKPRRIPQCYSLGAKGETKTQPTNPPLSHSLLPPIKGTFGRLGFSNIAEVMHGTRKELCVG